MRITRRTPAVALVAGLALSAPLLAGCSLVPHPGPGGGISVPGVSVGTGHLPKDWPSEVPVVKGDVVAGASLGSASKGKLWNATIKVGGSDVSDQITSQLTGAGFESSDIASTDAGSTATYRKDKLVVLVVVAKDDKDGWVANYSVTQDGDSN
jgi:hypothetical protein